MVNLVSVRAKFQLESVPLNHPRHEKSGVWFLQHIFHFSEGSSKLVGIFQKMQAGNVVFTTRTKAYFDNLCSGLMDSLN